jgi:AP-3 complex subunit delta-1
LYSFQTGIRSHKDNQKDFVNKSLQDIRAEVVSSDIRTKSIAIEKATYLHSLGFNMNWASFHVVELMSTANVKYKRVGYLAACQSFGDDTDVVLLIPNLLKKDLASPNPAEAALAISCLANIVTPELSQTLVADVYSLLNNHKPDLRLVSLQVLLAIPGSVETVLRKTDGMFRR